MANEDNENIDPSSLPFGEKLGGVIKESSNPGALKHSYGFESSGASK